jgi:hypothetical protein
MSLCLDGTPHSFSTICRVLEMCGRIEFGDSRIHSVHEDTEDLATFPVEALHLVLRHGRAPSLGAVGL